MHLWGLGANPGQVPWHVQDDIQVGSQYQLEPVEGSANTPVVVDLEREVIEQSAYRSDEKYQHTCPQVLHCTARRNNRRGVQK